MVTRRGRFPKDRETLEKFPALGQYMASAVLLLCHGRPEPLLDVNMARVIERYFGPRRLADIRTDRYLQMLARTVVSESPVDTNFGVLDLGAAICTARSPDCPACPLKMDCNYSRRLRSSMQVTGIVTLIVLGRKGPHGFPFRRPQLALSHTLNASFRNRLNVSLLHK